MTNKFTVKSGDIKYAFTNTKPNYSIMFHNDTNGVVGTLDFNGPEMVFTGRADESAQVFLNYVAQVFHERLKDEYNRAIEEAATTAYDVENGGRYLDAIRELKK